MGDAPTTLAADIGRRPHRNPDHLTGRGRACRARGWAGRRLRPAPGIVDPFAGSVATRSPDVARRRHIGQSATTSIRSGHPLPPIQQVSLAANLVVHRHASLSQMKRKDRRNSRVCSEFRRPDMRREATDTAEAEVTWDIVCSTSGSHPGHRRLVKNPGRGRGVERRAVAEGLRRHPLNTA